LDAADPIEPVTASIVPCPLCDAVLLAAVLPAAAVRPFGVERALAALGLLRLAAVERERAALLLVWALVDLARRERGVVSAMVADLPSGIASSPSTRIDGAQSSPEHRLGTAWVEPDEEGGWRKRRGRPCEGWLDERAAHAAAAAKVAEVERERASTSGCLWRSRSRPSFCGSPCR
jgi:hypothetical protein